MLFLSILLALFLGIHVELIVICGKKKKRIKPTHVGIDHGLMNFGCGKPPIRKVEKSERLSIRGSADDEEIKMPPTACTDVQKLRSQVTQVSETKPAGKTQGDISQKTARHKSFHKSIDQVHKSIDLSSQNLDTTQELVEVQPPHRNPENSHARTVDKTQSTEQPIDQQDKVD